MIIPDSFRQAYQIAVEKWEPVQAEVDGILQRLKDNYPSVQYYSRIKVLESVFIKAEKGDYETPLMEIEDFFACTLVVPTLTMIEPIKTALEEWFIINLPEIKPPDPYTFKYNDLHLILSLKDTPLRSDKTVTMLKFELQLKTLLQAAWSQAGHDIIYKPSRISWGNERIAGELRALLEMADNVLAQIENTAQLLHSRAEQEYSSYKADTTKIIQFMEQHWRSESLPANRRRMANIINQYKDMAGITTDDLINLVSQAKESSDQVFDYLTFTPTQVVFVLLFRQYRDQIIQKLQKTNRFRILITSEMADICPELRELDISLRQWKKGRVNFENLGTI